MDKLVAAVVTVASATAFADPAQGEVDYDRGWVMRKTGTAGAFELHLQGRIETLWDLRSQVDAMDERVTNAKLSIDRVRLELGGSLFTPAFEYKVQLDFGRGSTALKDGWAQGRLSKGVILRAGQFKRPYSRQQMTSSSKLALSSRALTDDAFRAGRDIGIALHDGYEASPELEWVVGVFNGTGDKSTYRGGILDPATNTVSGGTFTNVPVAWMPAFVGRMGYNHGGIKGYSESDLEGGPLRYAVALSLYGELDFDRDSTRTHQAELDAVLKEEGWFFTAAIYGLLVDTGTTTTQVGGHVQGGRVLGSGTSRFEPTARYAIVNPQDVGAVQEILFGLNWLPYGHQGKLMMDVGAHFDPSAAGDRGRELLAQVRLVTGFF